jgi:hypothetical protein
MYIDYCWLRNRWWKVGPPDPKNHPRSPVLWLMLTSSAQIDYSWQTNHWWKLSPYCPKYHSSAADAEIFNVHRLLLAQKPLTKTRTFGRKTHPRSPVLPLTLKSSMYVDYCWLRNRWRKLGHSDPKNNPRILVLRLTLTSFTHIDYCWQKNSRRKLSPWCPKIHPRNAVLRLTLKSSMYTDYCWLRNH